MHQVQQIELDNVQVHVVCSSENGITVFFDGYGLRFVHNSCSLILLSILFFNIPT